MRKLYLLSKPFNNKPRLIGVLSELKESNGDVEGEYQFEYKLGGVSEPPEYFLTVREFPDITKVYRGKEARRFVNRVIPPPDDRFIRDFFKYAGINEYNEWALMKYCGQKLCEDETSLRESIPKEAILYEQLETV